MAFPVLPPYTIYTDRDGNPVDNGYIYIGTANQNPQTNAITVYWDEAGTIPATQPIRTMGGYAWRNGTPANLYVNVNAFSIVVRDSNGTLVFSNQQAGSSSYIIFPESYGVVGDGVANDTVAWDRFMAALGAGVIGMVPAGFWVKYTNSAIKTCSGLYDVTIIFGENS